MIAIPDVKFWANNRLADHRKELEISFTLSEIETARLRGRIAELKGLLEMLENKASPTWSDASDI